MQIFSIAVLFLAAFQPTPAWHKPDNWNQVNPGTNSIAVRRLLGTPAATHTLKNGTQLWFYQELPELDTVGKIKQLPEHGWVSITAKNIVYKIKLPDFSVIPAPIEIKPKPIINSSATPVKPAPLPTVHNPPPQKIPIKAASPPIPAMKSEPAKIDNRQSSIKNSPPRPFASKYWLCAGGGLLLLAFLMVAVNPMKYMK